MCVTVTGRSGSLTERYMSVLNIKYIIIDNTIYTETEDLIQERLAKASREMNLKTRYDYVVINDNLEKASNEIKEIIKNKKTMIL